MTPHAPRLHGDDVLLGTRLVAALLVHRHENQVRRHCEPVACDVDSKAMLYDLDQAERQLATVSRRRVA